MKAVIDSSVFFSDRQILGELYTTPSVVEELKDLRSKGVFERYRVEGLILASPSKESIEQVRAAAIETKDAGVISDTDRDLLALALEINAVLYTDDFAIQNVASVLNVTTVPISQRKARRIHWKYRCSGCGKYFEKSGECPICGSQIKRKLK